MLIWTSRPPLSSLPQMAPDGKVLLVLSFLLVSGLWGQKLCLPCVTITPGDAVEADHVGFYRMTNTASFCPESCSYTKEGGNPAEVWCFQPGGYSFEEECQATLATQSSSSPSSSARSSSSSTEPATTDQSEVSSPSPLSTTTTQQGPATTEPNVVTSTTNVPGSSLSQSVSTNELVSP